MSITMFKELLLLLEIYLGGGFFSSIIMFVFPFALPISSVIQYLSLHRVPYAAKLDAWELESTHMTFLPPATIYFFLGLFGLDYFGLFHYYLSSILCDNIVSFDNYSPRFILYDNI